MIEINRLKKKVEGIVRGVVLGMTEGNDGKC
jgi:hypothetical protein